MKFIHTADWHLGKLVHGVYMTEDQRYVLKQFVKLVAEEKPDAVIIAGDLYDRAVPPTEAVELLNEILFEINVNLKTPVIAIAGNHDSAERLSFGSSWYEQSELFLVGKLDSDFKPININGVNFYPIPYAEPGTVRQILQDDSISSHETAMKAIINQITKQMNYNEPNVLIGHAFVAGGMESESERTLSVGGTGAVSAQIFEPFTYTALGHLHNPNAISHDKIRYSGSLLKYSFSEANQKKSVSIVEMNSDSSFSIRYHSFAPLHDMRELEGTMQELLDPQFYKNEAVNDYLKVILLDEGALIDPMNKLRQVYPNVLHLDRKIDIIDSEKRQTIQSIKEKEKSELQLFEQFYKEMTTMDFDNKKREIMTRVIDEVKREENLR